MDRNSFGTETTKQVLENFENLKKRHDFLISSTIDDEQRHSMEKCNDLISSGLEEIGLMKEIKNYVDYLKIETEKLDLQVERLIQENGWLRDELCSTEKNLQTSRENRIDFERKIDDLKSFLSAKVDEKNILFVDIEKEFPIENDEQSPRKQNEHFESKSHIEIPARFRTLHNLVIQYAQAGRYEVAVPLCRQALADLEKAHGHSHPDVATMLNILALVYRDQNKFQEALELLNEALLIREETLGRNHPAVAATLNNLAVLYGKKNRYKDAEPLCKRALEIREKSFGSHHPDVAKQLNNLALLCLNQGKFDEVEEYYKRALLIYQTNFGPTDINSLKTKNNLGSAYLREGKIQLAFELFRVLALDSREHPAIFCSALKNLILLCRRKNLQEQADELSAFFEKYSKNPKEPIDRILKLLKSNENQGESYDEMMRRSQGSSSSVQEYGRLRRSGSFQKLRQSIRRGSEKLVQKLRGAPTFNFSTVNEPMKRASSMSVLHQVSPIFSRENQNESTRIYVELK